MQINFISYAQNFEDVMLWRALCSYPPGRYVDVGANDPLLDSVTKAFYDRGWSGINVEADDTHFQKLCGERLRDRNVCNFVGADDGELEFFIVHDTGLSTFRPDYAERHRLAGHQVDSTKVMVRTLNSILEETGIENDEFHFLKVDVEGAEGEVFKGFDLQRFRPWIVVVEATEPNDPKECFDDYEYLIVGASYTFAYFDGLSRFYVADERRDLMRAFRTPPNVFDGFERWETVSAREKAGELQRDLSISERLRYQLENRLARVCDRLEDAVKGIYSSRRWRWSRIISIRSLIGGRRGFPALDKGLASLRELSIASKSNHSVDPSSSVPKDPSHNA